MPTIKGTASVADSRARQKALKKTKFPRNFRTPVSLEKVNKPVLTQWIEQKVTSILGFEDEIVSSTAINLFLPSDNASPDPKKAQLDLAGFLGDQAVTFSAELWKLMLEAQASTSGIPLTLLEQKKKEMTEKMAANNQDQQQKDPAVRVNRFSQANQNVGRGQNRNDNDRNHPPSGIQIPVHRPHGNLPGHGSPNKHYDKSNKNAASLPHHQPQSQRDKPKNVRKGSSGDVAGQNIDQFGRVLPPQRSRNTHRHNPRDQYDRNRPNDFEASRRSQRRSRSRSRDRYDHGRERGSDYRRRSDDRHRAMNDDTRRLDDRRYDSNHHRDDRSSYHHQNHRRHNDYYDHDRHRDGDDRRNRYHDYDREMDNLERRLSQLRKQCSGRDKKNNNRNMHRIDEEMKDVQDRIYELDRHRRRHNSSRDEYSHSRSHRGRSPSYEHRRGSRRRRSKSANSDRSDSIHSNRDDCSSNSAGSDRGSRSSYSPSPERKKKTKGSGSAKRHRRRRSRSFSSSEGSERSP